MIRNFIEWLFPSMKVARKISEGKWPPFLGCQHPNYPNQDWDWS